jgi:hypothetical protein
LLRKREEEKLAKEAALVPTQSVDSTPRKERLKCFGFLEGFLTYEYCCSGSFVDKQFINILMMSAGGVS